MMTTGVKLVAPMKIKEKAVSAYNTYFILLETSDILTAQRAKITAPPKMIAVSTAPPARKNGILEAKDAGIKE